MLELELDPAGEEVAEVAVADAQRSFDVAVRRALQDRYEDFRTQAREVLAQLDQLGRAGDKVRGRLGANLRSKLRFTSESLMRYDYKPNQVTRRRSTAAVAKAAAAAKKAAAAKVAATAVETVDLEKTEA